MARKLTQKEFISRALSKHGSKYDYSLAVYRGLSAPLVIKCRRHGEFTQRAGNHMNGTGCPSCNIEVMRVGTHGFISKSREVHGSYYDYSLASYTTNKGKVSIICPKHGVFEQVAGNHMNGSGCKACADQGKRITRGEFLARVKQLYGGKYSYHKSLFSVTSDKVVIICRDHGEFTQEVRAHLGGKMGCKGCNDRLLNDDKFIAKAKEVHGGKYSYARTSYSGSHNYVKITCRVHGDFEQVAHSHLNGRGCPNCKWDRNRPTHLYLMNAGSMVKVGVSVNVRKRLTELNSRQPFTCHLSSSWVMKDYDEAITAEREVHNRLAVLNSRLSGFDGATEWFNTTTTHAAEVITQVINSMQ